MRRVALAAALTILIVFGFGSAYVLAQTGTTNKGVALCHSGNGKHFTAESPDAPAVLRGHAYHSHDIIPPFELIADGTTTNYPGKNLDATFGAGYTGAEVLANHCNVPIAGLTATTETVRTVVTEAIPTVLSIPATVVTLGVSSSTTVVTESMSIPQTTATAAGATTVVTIAPNETALVTVPPNTVTLPASTVTVRDRVTQPARTATVHGATTTIPAKVVTSDGVVTQAAETVTVPGTTQTVTAAGGTTVMTVTAPSSQIVSGGEVAERRPLVIVNGPRLVRIRGHVLRVVLRHVRRTTKVVVIVVRPGAAGRG